MAALLNPAFLYVGSDKWTAVAAWTALTSYTAGQMVRQLAAPTLGNERVFVCIVAGVTLASEPAWTVTKGAKTAEAAGPTWQECTGQPPVNGDATHTLAWTASAKSNTVALGQIIKRDNGVSYQICTTAGTAGSGAEPSFSDTAGTTTADNTVTWTSLGVVGNFAAFAAPHQRILNADASTWSTVAGSTFYISNAHAETQASAMTLAGGQGVINTPSVYVCVSNATAPPTAATTGATVSTTGASDLTIRSFAYYSGIAFNAGSAANAANILIGTVTLADHGVFLESCSLVLNNTNTGSTITLGPTSSARSVYISTKNTTFVFGATAQNFLPQNAAIDIVGGSIAATGSVPTSLFEPAGGVACSVYGCDLSNVTGTLVTAGNATFGYMQIINCKIGAATIFSGVLGSFGFAVKLHNSDNGSKNYRFSETKRAVAPIAQDTVTYNNAGASDGTQPISWKIITANGATLTSPYVSPEITIWQDTTGSIKTATIEIAGASTLTNADIWMELEYPGNSSFPISSRIDCRVADVIATAANVPTSSASWSGSPSVKQYLQVTFTPQMKGPVKARIYVAKVSATVYVDPMITVA